MKLYEKIASLTVALANCKKSDNKEWAAKHRSALEDIERNSLPSGSGVDQGTKIRLDMCIPRRIVLETSFHHMNEYGMYDGWTEHFLTIMPDFISGIDIKISGKNRNDIKDYLHNLFYDAMTQEVNDVK